MRQLGVRLRCFRAETALVGCCRWQQLPWCLQRRLGSADVNCRRSGQRREGSAVGAFVLFVRLM